MRKSAGFLFLLLAGCVSWGALMVHAQAQRTAQRPVLARNALLVERLGLTDLALFTEARYTRHLSQADLHSAFQDHPLSFDHFPTGSIAPPPPRLANPHGR